MSSIAASGGLWPEFGTSTTDVVRALLATQVVPAGDTRRLSGRDLPDRTTPRGPHLENEGCSVYSPSCPDVVLEWNVEGNDKSGQEYQAGRVLHRTLADARDVTLARSRDEGPELAIWSPASTFFPFWMDVEIRTRLDEDPPQWWDLRADYAWAVRHVFTPLGASTFMEFHQIGQVWGSLPDSPMIFRLPDDFTTVESDAWSLFDRPAPTPEDPR